MQRSSTHVNSKWRISPSHLTDFSMASAWGLRLQKDVPHKTLPVVSVAQDTAVRPLLRLLHDTLADAGRRLWERRCASLTRSCSHPASFLVPPRRSSPSSLPRCHRLRTRRRCEEEGCEHALHHDTSCSLTRRFFNTHKSPFK